MYKCVDDYFDETGEPIKCTKCDCVDLVKLPSDLYNDSFAFYCIRCNTRLGFWTLGTYCLEYKKHFLSNNPQNSLLDVVREVSHANDHP